MQACAVPAPSFASHPESWAKPAGELAKEVWRSLPDSRMRQALNFDLATSSPSGGRSDMAWLLMMRRPASLAHAGSAHCGAATRYCPAFGTRASGRRRGLDLTLWLWWPDAGHSLTGAPYTARACRFSRLQSTYNAGRYAATILP